MRISPGRGWRWLRSVLRDRAARVLVLMLLATFLWLRSYWRADSAEVFAHEQHAAEAGDGVHFRATSKVGFITLSLNNTQFADEDRLYWASPEVNWHIEARGTIGREAEGSWSEPPLHIEQVRMNPALTFRHYGWWKFALLYAGFDGYARAGTNRFGSDYFFFQVDFPWWAVGALLLGVELLVLRPRIRRWRRRRRGRCPGCGYDLRVSPGRCPECGTTGAGT